MTDPNRLVELQEKRSEGAKGKRKGRAWVSFGCRRVDVGWGKK